MAVSTPICDFGWQAVDFSLPDTEGRLCSLDQSMGLSGILLMFICNHCPYVQSILPRLVMLADQAMSTLSMGVLAISSNDSLTYPEDGPEQMKEIAHNLSFPFSYLYDEDQSVAKTYGAACTPDFFVFNAEKALQYRGRYDASGKESLNTPVDETDLWRALLLIVQTGQGPEKQYPSMGCSIKWRNDT